MNVKRRENVTTVGRAYIRTRDGLSSVLIAEMHPALIEG